MSEKVEEVARERVENKFGLLTHFLVYVIVNSFLFGFDFFVTREADWSYIPMFFWGLGLCIHALTVVFENFLGDWKERMVKKEVDKLKEKK
jgi:uncharacterized membrane protein